MNDTQPTIYFNCSCSKSKQTLELLKKQGFEPTIINYLDNPPTIDELKIILKQLNLPAIDILRRTEPVFLEAGLDADDLSEDDLLEAITGCPSLLQRPIVIYNNKAALGRPAENVLDILK